MAEVEVRTVVAAETVFLVRECGSGGGVPVLLLHGAPETSSSWRDVAPALAHGRRVLAPDLPGLGGSTFTGPYDIPVLVEQLAALIEAEVEGPVDVAGHDWGGVLALALAGLRPDLVRRLAVLNAPYRQPAPFWRAAYIAFFALPLAPEGAFAVAGRRIVDAMLRAGWGRGPALDDERRAEYEAAYAPRAAVSALMGYYRAVARPRRGALLPGTVLGAVMPPVDKPGTVVVWGAEDPALPISVGEAVVRELGPATRMVTIPGAGHFVVVEAPEVVAEVLAEAFG
ncbi:MAG: alpha/beta hydrolase fold protein [Frankiales bacterium]|nr:alpha/beta hydrolase fold protein [Frankiales bacterium]